jgi:hypothetical protein
MLALLSVCSFGAFLRGKDEVKRVKSCTWEEETGRAAEADTAASCRAGLFIVLTQRHDHMEGF